MSWRLRQMAPFNSRLGPPLALGFFGGAALFAAWLEPVPPPLGGSAHAVDGDTVRFGEVRVRLLGIDAPELGQMCADRQGLHWSRGETARAAMIGMVESRKMLCAPHGHDKYGRLLARCSADGKDIAAAMVGAGLAVSDPDYGAEEAGARAAATGIWAGPFLAPADWRRQHGGTPAERNFFGWLRGWFP